MLCLNESCFAFGFVVGIHNALSSGQTVLQFTWYDTDKLFFAIKRYKPDVLIGYNNTVASINKLGARSEILKSVDRIIVGGGLLTSSQKATLFEIAQTSGRKLSLCSITGCDELLTYAYGPSDLQSDRLLGFPLPGVIMKVADSMTGLDAPEGSEGEIAVCSPVSAYLKEGESKTDKERYKKLPDGRIWYFTGKIGKLDGNKMFYLVGSKSREARINSYPVYPDMVDEAVQMTEGVVEACSVIIENPEGPVLISAVVPEEEYFYDNSMMEDLRDRIKSECELTLHEAMRPSEVTFLVSLPRDSRGVIDYEAVKEKVEMIQNEDVADDVLPEPLSTE
jgi:acyl-coenzyme A synthetase/AMP-(fatty) acid ligase